MWPFQFPAPSPGPSSRPQPAHHANSAGTLFKNPWPSAEKPTWAELRLVSQSSNKSLLSWYSSHDLLKHPRAQEVKVVAPDWGASSLKERSLQKEKCVVGTWLGHAGVMVELPVAGAASEDSPGGLRAGKTGLWILFDPIFSARAGPTAYTGPGRLKNNPCQVNDLPVCDAVCISHNHYDHLDLPSIKAISAKFPKCKYFVPLGNKSWLAEGGVPKDQIYELDWWDDRELSLQDLGFEEATKVEDVSKGEDTKIRFTCVPAQHNSGRGTLDQGSTLWCGWVVEQFLGSGSDDSKRTRRGAIFHAGDTGYRRTSQSDVVCPVFEEIGKKFGSFDLSFVPIWRGGSLGFVSGVGLRLSHQHIPASFHASPADAIEIHRDVRSRNTVGVHFGTFIGSENESYEAIIEFDEAREGQGIQRFDDLSEGSENGRVGTLDIGGSIAIEI